MLIVKWIPLWMPGSGFKRQAHYVKSLVRQLLDTPFEMVQRRLVRIYVDHLPHS